ncbi:hypothetical protein OKW21_002353 [Catalinimonas alkaloidigena]|uniref:hypothetical protein n=1 Tax=Catalinimonas alkaloidigena TaxID=1075417 RepID=UPI002407367C|nr:hypothetical protein [Catalinimonas alkaloidigena]MDF9797090.1 hypothetical protein [Catalinimonas alkaloidigena]
MKKRFDSVLKRIMYPSIAATTNMTLFSYAASYLVNDQFKEPKLLSYFFFTPGKKKANQPPIGGFLLHYLVGAGFAVAYQFVWKRFFKFPEWKDGLSYGALCSLVGMLTWKIVFATHQSPPRIQLKSYLFHLFIAHLIFGVTLSKTKK